MNASMIQSPIQLHANVTPDVTDWIVLWYVPMIVLVWERVNQPQEPALAMKDAMEMTVLWFVQAFLTPVVLVWEHLSIIHPPIQLHVTAILGVSEMTVPFLPVPRIVLVGEHVTRQQEPVIAMKVVSEMIVIQTTIQTNANVTLDFTEQTVQ